MEIQKRNMINARANVKRLTHLTPLLSKPSTEILRFVAAERLPRLPRSTVVLRGNEAQISLSSMSSVVKIIRVILG